MQKTVLPFYTNMYWRGRGLVQLTEVNQVAAPREDQKHPIVRLRHLLGQVNPENETGHFLRGACAASTAYRESPRGWPIPTLRVLGPH
jgi:hypothetical protein